MIQVCLVGQRFWSEKLIDLIHHHGRGRINAWLLSRPDLTSIRRISTADVFLRMGYRPAAPNARGMLFDLAWTGLRYVNPTAKVVYYWLGTDVLKELQDGPKGRVVNLFHKIALRDRHICGAPWFVDELAQSRIKASCILFPHTLPHFENPSVLPETFRVLSYISETALETYGAACLFEAARRLPHVPFDIVGMEGRLEHSAPPNVSFHGWQRDMRPYYINASVVVRLVPHDAVGGTVREGLAYGRHVIYTYEVPFTTRVRLDVVQDTVDAIDKLWRKHVAGKLEPNLAGREYALREFDPARNTESLISYLLGVGDKG